MFICRLRFGYWILGIVCRHHFPCLNYLTNFRFDGTKISELIFWVYEGTLDNHVQFTPDCICKSTQLSIIFQLCIKTKMLKNKDFFYLTLDSQMMFLSCL